MKIFLKNIGKLGEAKVDIEGISVIAGKNSTGKSTVGKALFSAFNSFYHFREKIDSERTESIERAISMIYRNTNRRFHAKYNTYQLARNIVADYDSHQNDIEEIKKQLESFIQNDGSIGNSLEDLDIDNIVLRIQSLLKISDEDIFKFVVDKKLNAEFNDQVNNIFSDDMGHIVLQIKDKEMEIVIKDNDVIEMFNSISLDTEAIYIDDPFILDELPYRFLPIHSDYGDHRMQLQEKLSSNEKRINTVEEILVNKRFKNIYEKISSVCSGELFQQKNGEYGYKGGDTDKILNVKNLSTGLKTFTILKTLLVNGIIEENGLIILDEPEIHLHPEWQLLFAELIVMLYKEFGLHVLLNTHSPYFLRAIQVYAAKYEVADKCKYYLSEEMDNEVSITDVTDNIERIYAKLSKPLQNLEDERWENA